MCKILKSQHEDLLRLSFTDQPVHLVGYHVKGGTIAGENVTNFECKKICAHKEACLAVDYDSFNNLCWSHGKETHCGHLHVQLGTSHYKKVPCKGGTYPNYFLVNTLCFM